MNPIRSRQAKPSDGAEQQWFVIGRWQEYAGEARANLLRISAIASFYLIELLNFHGLHLGPIDLAPTVDLKFHQAATALTAAWALLALATLVCLRIPLLPPWLKYATTLGDAALLTMILMLADGPRSPLVVGYFLIIVLATLRFRLRLIWFATLACMASYLTLNGYATRFVEGRDIAVPVYYQLIMLLSLGLSGIVLGQVIRRVRLMATDLLLRAGLHAGGGTR